MRIQIHCGFLHGTSLQMSYVCMRISQSKVPLLSPERKINIKAMAKSLDSPKIESPLRILPSLLLLRPESKQCPFSPLLSRNLDNQESHKITQCPVTAMRAQHVEVLDIQRAATTRKIIINLTVVVEEKHAFFGNLLTSEVVGLELDIGWELGDCCRASRGCGGQQGWRG
jgi:hypothetical protein